MDIAFIQSNSFSAGKDCRRVLCSFTKLQLQNSLLVLMVFLIASLQNYIAKLQDPSAWHC